MNKIEQFNEYRALLFSIAYRMLGSVMEAEDMVQETFLRWQQTNVAEVQSAKAYLTTIITRLCIDHLRSAQVQREQYIGPWLPEPVVTEKPLQADDSALLAESLSMAFLVLLESLTPTERAVFLLREVFDYNYSEVAQIVGKSEANCRQVARRARQHVHNRRPRFDPSPTEQQRLTVQFMETCAKGDMPGLLNLLATDITLWSDGGGKAVAALNPLHGAERVARFCLGITRKAAANVTVRLAWVNGQPGIIGYEAGRPITIFIFEIFDGVIQAIHSIRNPDKLEGVPADTLI